MDCVRWKNRLIVLLDVAVVVGGSGCSFEKGVIVAAELFSPAAVATAHGCVGISVGHFDSKYINASNM